MIKDVQQAIKKAQNALEHMKGMSLMIKQPHCIN
jgi:hypothetical protein